MATSFEDSIKKAAQRADRAVRRTMAKYARGLVTDEEELTGVLVGNLDAKLEGPVGTLVWSTSILRHRKGAAAEESAIGADMIIHVRIDTAQRRYSRGVLIQAKRIEPKWP